MTRVIVLCKYVVIEGSLLVPNVYLANISRGGMLSFKWLDTNSMVHPKDYIILSNCGTCPLFTSNTSVTCQADVQGQSRVCQFAVLTRTCDRIYGNPSPQFLSVMLRGKLLAVLAMLTTYLLCIIQVNIIHVYCLKFQMHRN